MGLGGLAGTLARMVCSLAGHRFVVWARSSAEAPRHPHLGAWARCIRCGHERDWLGDSVSADAQMLDLVHGGVRPLREIVSIARGAPIVERAAPPAALAGAPQPARSSSSASGEPPATRSGRRGSGEGRGSSRREGRPLAQREHEPQER